MGDRLAVVLLPELEVATHLGENPLPQRHGETGRLHDREHLSRGHPSAGRVLPAQQGLEAHQSSSVSARDGLVREQEVLVRQRIAQLPAEVAVTVQRRPDAMIHDPVVPPAGLLGSIHGGVRFPQQGLGHGTAGPTDRRPDAGGQPQRPSLDVEGVGQHVGDFVGDPVGLVPGGQVLADEHELVPRKSSDRVTRPQDAAEPLGDRDEDLVTDMVSVIVVDLLEVVEIGEQHRHQRAVAGGSHHRLVQALHQQGAVRQPGERVVERLLPHEVQRVRGLSAVAGVVQVGGCDVRQSLPGLRGRGVQLTRDVAVEVERPERAVVGDQGEGEDRGEPCIRRPLGEAWEALVDGDVRDRHRLATAVGLQTRPLVELVLQRLDLEDRLVRGCREVQLVGRPHQRHSGARDRQHLDDPQHQVVQDLLDPEPLHEPLGELGQHFGQVRRQHRRVGGRAERSERQPLGGVHQDGYHHGPP